MCSILLSAKPFLIHAYSEERSLKLSYSRPKLTIH